MPSSVEVDFLAALSREFSELAGERLVEIDGLIELLSDPSNGNDRLAAIQRHTHTLKGNGGTFGFPNISLIAHQAEDYMLHAGARLAPKDLRRFFDRMEDVLAGRMPAEGATDRVLADLPRAFTFDSADIKRQEIEVVLVMEAGAQAHLVRREFEACGYSVILISRTLEALDYIHRVKPDLVVISAVMTGLSGVELAIALKALPTTRDIPCALTTSLSGRSDLAELPRTVPVIRKGQHFSDDVALALDYLKIT